jgi:hypothetical protein
LILNAANTTVVNEVVRKSPRLETKDATGKLPGQRRFHFGMMQDFP